MSQTGFEEPGSMLLPHLPSLRLFYIFPESPRKPKALHPPLPGAGKESRPRPFPLTEARGPQRVPEPDLAGIQALILKGVTLWWGLEGGRPPCSTEPRLGRRHFPLAHKLPRTQPGESLNFWKRTLRSTRYLCTCKMKLEL